MCVRVLAFLGMCLCVQPSQVLFRGNKTVSYQENLFQANSFDLCPTDTHTVASLLICALSMSSTAGPVPDLQMYLEISDCPIGAKLVFTFADFVLLERLLLGLIRIKCVVIVPLES